MRNLIIASVDALIPLGIAVLLLARPQWFTKKDLHAEENRRLAGTLRKVGWVLIAAGLMILIANIGSTITRK
jgi:hypothetical protein